MKCKKALFYISLKLDDALSFEEGKKLDSHLQNCANCQKELCILQKQEMFLKNLKFDEIPKEFMKAFTVNIPPKVQKNKWQTKEYLLLAAVVIISGYLGFLAFYKNISTPKIEIVKSDVGLKEIWQKALVGNQQMQNKILQDPSLVSYEEILKDNKFLKNEDFVLEVISSLKNKVSFDVLLFIHQNGLEKQKSLKILCAREPRRSLPILLECLKQEDLKLTVMDLLVRIETISAPYIYNLMENNSEIPIEIWDVLSSFSKQYSLPILTKYSQKGNYREQAILALGKTQSSKAVKILLDNWVNRNLRANIISALNKLKPYSIQAITQLLKHGNNDAIEIAGEMRASDFTPILLQLVHTSYGKKVIESLALIGDRDPQVVDFFIDLARSQKYQKMACLTLGKIGHPKGVQFLTYGINDNSLRSNCLRALKDTKDPSIVEPIVNMVLQKGMTNEAMDILMGMPKKEVLPYFVYMLGHSRLKSSAKKALRELTDQDFGTNIFLWKNWLKRNDV